MSNLIERYIYDVTNKLPENQREDVGKELKVTIEDMVANRVENGEDEAKAINSVLMELGNPLLLAPKYSSAKQFLIGPRFFFIYKMVLVYVLKYALPAVGIVFFLLRLLEHQGSIIQLILGVIFAVINIAIMIIFWITVIFVLIEHYDTEIPELNEEWKPEMLPKLPGKRQISLTDGWMEIVTTVISLIFTIYLANGLDVLNLDLWRPIWIVLVIIQITDLIRNLFALKIGNWTRSLVLFNTVIGSITIILGFVFIRTPNIFKEEFTNRLVESGVSNAAQIVPWIVQIAAATIIFICFVQIVDGIRKHLQYRKKVLL